MHLTCSISRGVLCWFEVEQSRMLGCWLGWSDLLVWFGGGGLIRWADFGGLVWRWSGVGGGAWSDLWSDLTLLRLSGVVVWSEVDFMGCAAGLILWANLEVCLRKMIWSDGWKLERWEAEEIVVIRLWTLHRATYRETKKKYGSTLIFKLSCNWKLWLIPWKGLQRLHQTNIGLCWRSFRIFSICSNNRKLQCLTPCSQSRLCRNIFAR